MVFGKLNKLIKKSKKILQEEGFFSLFKRTLGFLFSYGTYSLYERSTNDRSRIAFSPEAKKYKLKIIQSLKELKKLELNGYDFRAMELTEGIKSGALPFCFFSGKEIAHVTWVATNEKAKRQVDKIPFKINFQKSEVCTGNSFTDPSHRGKGLLSYAYYNIFSYLDKHGFQKVKFTIKDTNIASQKGAAKFDPKIIGKGAYLKILRVGIWKELPLK